MKKIFDWAATDREFPPIAGRGRGHLITDPPLDVDEALEVRESIRQLPERDPNASRSAAAQPDHGDS